jgi:hypothetical protein
MRGICFLKFGNKIKMNYVATNDFCKVKTVYIISIFFFFKVWVSFHSDHAVVSALLSHITTL